MRGAKGGPKKRRKVERIGPAMMLWEIRHDLAMHGEAAGERGCFWLTRERWARIRFPGEDPSPVFIRFEWWRWRRWAASLGIVTAEEREGANQNQPIKIALSMPRINRSVGLMFSEFKENSGSDY